MSDDPAPVTRTRAGAFSLRLAPEERLLITGLLEELRALVTDPDPPPAVRRLFPVSYPEDPEHEAEYQRLMRHELVTSKLAGIDTVTEVLARSGRLVRLDEAELLAVMQALNGVRLVLGTMLDVTEDDGEGIVGDDDEPDVTPEHHLYGYLSWLLEASVQAMAGQQPP